MSWFEKLKNVERIRERMQDEESRVIFDARLGYMCNGDRYRYEYFDQIDQFPKEWRSAELKELMKNGEKPIVIYGYNQLGIEQKRVIELCKYKVSCWCDELYQGQVLENIPVISLKELINSYNDAIVVISSKFADEGMRNDLKQVGFPEENIYSPKYGVIVAMTGNQYFDIFRSCEKEVFIDAGAYDGKTIREFFEWAGQGSHKVYSMEPLPDMYKSIEKKVLDNQWNNVQLENYAVWDKEESLQFVMADAGSRVNFLNKTENVINVKAKDIDSIVKDDEITYIKMDVEGSELKALIGAAKCIRKNKPKLAICIYHRPGDVIELTDYILSLNPEYRFWLRHYASNMWETVLYAE